MAAVKTAEPSAIATKTLTGGQALTEMLRRNGVDTIFGLPGVQLDGFFVALHEATDDIRVIHTRHEQATAYMADGYARATGREGVCAVVPGPGLLNAAAALSTAYACNSPVLCVTGQIRSAMIDHGRGLLHEIHDQLGMIRHITKHAERAMAPAEIPGVVDRAFGQLRSGRIRPVEIEVPPDTLFAEEETELLAPAAERSYVSPDPDLVDQAAKLLGEAQSPLICAGGGILAGKAWDELLQLAELLEAPVAVTRNGRGAISDRHYLAQSPVAESQLRAKADVVLAVGTRFVDASDTPRQVAPGAKLIRIDIDPEEISRDVTPDIALIGDAKAGLADLAGRVSRYNRARPSREEELMAVKRWAAELAEKVLPQAAYAMAIRNALPDEGIIVGEMTQIAYWSNFAMPFYGPNTYITPGYQGTLGFGFCTALGAKVGRPDVPVVSINGDGGFGFTLNELATMAQHQIGVIALVFNDSAYGNVRRIQQDDLGGKLIASDLRNPDYVKLADAFGVAARRVDSPEALGTAITEAIRADEPTLIEIPVGPMPNPWRAMGLRP